MRRAAAIAVAVTLSACAHSSSHPLDAASLPTLSPTGAGPACRLPSRIAAPVWIPADLPLPGGSYVTRDLGLRDGIHQAELVVPSAQDAVARFIQDRWPAAGYELGEGDAEPGKEIDQEFSGSGIEGAAKFEVVNCDPGYQQLFLSIREA